MKNNPFISVILPVYNVQDYIVECLYSIHNQTIQDFEIIIIDDCSTDNTLSLIKSYKDDRIKLILKDKNRGLIDSLNIGFREAKGKYIARVDGDDINALDRFEKQLLFLESHPDIDACGSWLQTFGSYSKTIKHKENHNEIQANLLISNPMSLGATMLRAESYKKFEFDRFMLHVEDYDFWARSTWECKMHNLQEVLYYYRTHKKQVSKQFKRIQMENDINIKLALWKKIGYDKSIYKDDFIIKILYTNNLITSMECKLFFSWLRNVSLINKNQKVFDVKELIVVIQYISRNFIFDIFFTNNRIGINSEMRKEILKTLPTREIFYVASKKFKEKLKIFIKSNIKKVAI